MAFVDAVDSIYQNAKARISAVNPSRVTAGLLAAQDWPPKNVKLEAFYLLDLGEAPAMKAFYSATVPVKFHQLQWVWIVKGTELQQGVRAANRGDRFRTMQTMKGELTNGLFPGFTEKKTWSLDASGNWIGVSLNPVEFITWTPVEFHERLDKDSGIMYGSGAVRVCDETDAITS